MTRKTRLQAIALTLAGVLCVIVACALSIPLSVKAQSPVGDALATLAAATAQAQIIRQQQEAAYAAQRATVQAVMIEQTRTAAQVQATATGIAIRATQSAMDELTRQRAMTATAQAMNAQATRTAQEATATAEALNAQVTRETYQAQATAQAVLWSEQATAVARQNETAATRQQRFSWGLLIVELGFIAGALLIISWLTRTLVLWAKRLAPQSVNDAPTLADVITTPSQAQPEVIEQSAEPEPRMPSTVQVFDDPRMVEALDRWAERYDEEHLNG